jgi:predicted Rossmann fold flavoprotein
VVRNILASSGQTDAVEWFARMGVTLKREETGKLFPTSNSARTVLGSLVQKARSLGISILTDHRVQQILPPSPESGGLFGIIHSQGRLVARQVILATGGRSLPKSGSDGQGWELARRLGHSVTPTHPALVPLVLEKGFFHVGLSGLAHPAELSVWVKGKRMDCRCGDLLWTHFGISGPVTMDTSRHWVVNHASDPATELHCSFLPGQSLEQVDQWLRDCADEHPRSFARRVLAGRLPQRLADALVSFAGLNEQTTMARITRDQRRKLAGALVKLVLPVTGDRGWNHAEATAGGVPLAEIDYRTMRSRKVPGLFLAGEMLDCDGRIGGFNFQWAWSTGHLAGRAAAAACGG